MSQNNLKDLILNKTVFMSLKGQLNPFNALAFKKNIFNIPDDKAYLILDLTNLSSISGDGIKVFFESIKYFQKRNGIVILINPKEEILLLIKFLKLLNYVIITKNHYEAKQFIENHVKKQISYEDFEIKEYDFESLIEEKSDSENKDDVMDGNNEFNVNPYHSLGESFEELNHLKNNFNEMNQRFVKIGEKVQNLFKSSLLANENLFEFISKKIEDIKQSNESYFKEFQFRFDSIQDSHKELKSDFNNLKKDVEELKLAIHSTKPSNTSLEGNLQMNKDLKKINGYLILSCQNCGQPLRVKQYGKHMCPNCNAQFNVLPSGEVKFFEHT